jgi:hypothetical protein
VGGHAADGGNGGKLDRAQIHEDGIPPDTSHMMQSRGN